MLRDVPEQNVSQFRSKLENKQMKKGLMDYELSEVGYGCEQKKSVRKQFRQKTTNEKLGMLFSQS